MDGWMDEQELVKSHLMFAVREEVNGLQKRIGELVARNSRLEFENALLRQHASPAVLAQLPPRICIKAPNTEPDTPTTTTLNSTS